MYRVMMTIGGEVSPSSCLFVGPYLACEACVDRLLRGNRHPSVRYAVLPCVE